MLGAAGPPGIATAVLRRILLLLRADGVVRRRGRALVLIWVGMVSLWIWVGGVRALGRLRGRAGAGGGAAAEYVFVGGMALGAGRLAGAQR
ncbi:hypothetical protein B0H13DRAFT_2086947, partial [Mycena leptocephala]